MKLKHQSQQEDATWWLKALKLCHWNWFESIKILLFSILVFSWDFLLFMITLYPSNCFNLLTSIQQNLTGQETRAVRWKTESEQTWNVSNNPSFYSPLQLLNWVTVEAGSKLMDVYKMLGCNCFEKNNIFEKCHSDIGKITAKIRFFLRWWKT